MSMGWDTAAEYFDPIIKALEDKNKALIAELKAIQRHDTYSNCTPDYGYGIESSTYCETSDTGEDVSWDDIEAIIKKFEGETK